MDIKRLYKKYKDIIPYLFFGVCTTIVNVAVYWVAVYILHMPVMAGTLSAWFLAVLFAYITNRKWVFGSEANGLKEVWKEGTSFFACRLLTGIVDWACMFIFVNILALNDVVIKFLANVLVIVLNYVASKLIIFRKK